MSCRVRSIAALQASVVFLLLTLGKYHYMSRSGAGRFPVLIGGNAFDFLALETKFGLGYNFCDISIFKHYPLVIPRSTTRTDHRTQAKNVLSKR